MSSDQHLRGVLIAFLAFFAYAVSDASVKAIAGAIPAYESAFLGTLIGMAALPLALAKGEGFFDMMRTTNRPLWFVRFVSSALSSVGAIVAFTHLSMAEAFVLIFLMPSLIIVLSVVFLKERVGVRRWSAVLIGFAGVLIVLRPGFRELTVGHLGAFICALGAAVSVVILRAMGPKETNASLFGAGMLGVIVLCGLASIPTFQMPTRIEWVLLASYGLLAAIASVLLIHATAEAPASLVGTTQYSQMIWAVLFGYLFFGDDVDAPMAAGIALIVGSGMLTLMREKKRGVVLPPQVP
ncbi:transporter [Rhodomicrobium udaipurense JA643]|uniref:DMT family transporter n=1 Tax=Rhodomicrobium udaipurense TaxID=1202716 RepID=A0A8I1GG81_9HYPH|nr:DMT family transporter [Rhodomicrobium udaipurense]KAI94384.1 transporter [Rhodomicrobium udaipurense JA643]MBJ7544579.1 DMT family transporter [Rhodomicrobium udaipurense]